MAVAIVSLHQGKDGFSRVSREEQLCLYNAFKPARIMAQICGLLPWYFPNDVPVSTRRQLKLAATILSSVYRVVIFLTLGIVVWRRPGYDKIASGFINDYNSDAVNFSYLLAQINFCVYFLQAVSVFFVFFVTTHSVTRLFASWKALDNRRIQTAKCFRFLQASPLLWGVGLVVTGSIIGSIAKKSSGDDMYALFYGLLHFYLSAVIHFPVMQFLFCWFLLSNAFNKFNNESRTHLSLRGVTAVAISNLRMRHAKLNRDTHIMQEALSVQFAIVFIFSAVNICIAAYSVVFGATETVYTPRAEILITIVFRMGLLFLVSSCGENLNQKIRVPLQTLCEVNLQSLTPQAQQEVLSIIVSYIVVLVQFRLGYSDITCDKSALNATILTPTDLTAKADL